MDRARTAIQEHINKSYTRQVSHSSLIVLKMILLVLLLLGSTAQGKNVLFKITITTLSFHETYRKEYPVLNSLKTLMPSFVL